MLLPVLQWVAEEATVPMIKSLITIRETGTVVFLLLVQVIVSKAMLGLLLRIDQMKRSHDGERDSKKGRKGRDIKYKREVQIRIRDHHRYMEREVEVGGEKEVELIVGGERDLVIHGERDLVIPVGVELVEMVKGDQGGTSNQRVVVVMKVAMIDEEEVVEVTREDLKNAQSLVERSKDCHPNKESLLSDLE